MLTESGYEAAIRLLIACIAIAAGTLFLFAGMTNTTIDGEPFSYPLLEHSNFIPWSAPSVAAIVYLFLWRDLRILSWLFTAFCCFWAFTAYSTYSSDGYKFSYWHQGDAVSSGCDSVYFALSGATLVFAICASVAAELLPGLRTKTSKVRTTSSIITFIVLLFYSFAILIS